MSQPSSPSRSRPVVWIGIAAVVVLVIAGAYGLWYLFLRPSGPAAVNIGAVPIPSATAAAASGAAGAAASASSGASGAGLDGTWKVDTSLGSFSDFTDSFVGYRVQEQLASIGANVAVGRTPSVSGQITIDGTKVTDGQFTADLTSLQSDDQRRDGQLRRQGIQTQQFPNATFTLTQPIDFSSVPADGQAVNVTATGDFTLHGVTKRVQVPLAAKRSSDVIIVTGSMPVAFADYGIQAPNSFVVLSVDDHGTVEFQLLFTRA